MAKKKTCRVEFITKPPLGPAAVLYDAKGRAINLRNYPRGHTMTAKDRTQAIKSLMKGCGELSRRR